MDSFLFYVARAYFKARWLGNQSRNKVRQRQRQDLDETILSAWDHSPFYRQLWHEAGIKREDLKNISLDRLPVVNKKQLMAAFPSVVTEPHITRQDVEDFIQSDHTGKEWYRGQYVAMNTSGSSGVVGIFLYTKQFWARLMGIVAARALRITPLELLRGEIRLGFVGETSGHHAGISLINAAPSFLHARSVDVDASQEKLREMLENHMPTILVGYSSGVATVADMAIEHKLNIQPETIVCSGEALPPAREQRIQQAFGVRPINFYGATECLAMGASLYESGTLDIFDDLLYIEAVDDNGHTVAPGNLGRVVITVLNNPIFPLIRYAIDDEISLIPDDDDHPFTRAKEISGRKMDRLSLTLASGRSLVVHPMDLVGFFFPGLKQYQVVQTGPHHISVHAVFEGDQTKAREQGFALIDEMLAADKLTREDIEVKIEFVDQINPNPKTGKTPIVVPLDATASPATIIPRFAPTTHY